MMKRINKKRILVIGHPLVVATNRLVWSELARINGVSVDIICPKSWKSNLINDVNFKSNDQDSPFDNIFPLRCYNRGNGSLYHYSHRELLKILSDNKYDEIFLTQETWSLSLTQLTILKKVTNNSKTPINLWVCQNIIKKKLWFILPLEWFNMWDVKRILACTKEVVSVTNWKKIKRNVYYFPFSFNRIQYENKKFNFQKQPLRIGYLGRVSEEKGIRLLINLSKKLKEKNIAHIIKVAGTGDLVNDILEHDSFEYLGLLKHEEAHLFYDDIDLFILPSITKKFWKEQFGRVLIESIASGRAVIGSDSGAISEVLGLLAFPYVFTENDVDSLLHCVESILKLDEQGELEDQVTYARRKCFNTFSHEAVAQRALELVRNKIDPIFEKQVELN